MSFQKSQLKQIRYDMEVALASVAAKHNLNFEIGNFRYDDYDFSTKIKAFIGNKNSKTIKNEKIEKDWQFYAAYYGLDENGVGKSFSHNGKIFTIKGFDNRKRKYPVIASNKNGQNFKFPLEIIKNVTLRG